jgi:hypothetical protein
MKVDSPRDELLHVFTERREGAKEPPLIATLTVSIRGFGAKGHGATMKPGLARVSAKTPLFTRFIQYRRAADLGDRRHFEPGGFICLGFCAKVLAWSSI